MLEKLKEEAEKAVKNRECITAPITARSLVFKHIKEKSRELIHRINAHRGGVEAWEKQLPNYLFQAYYMASFLDENHKLTNDILWAIESKNMQYETIKAHKPALRTKIIRDVKK